MFGNHGLCGLLEEGAHEKSPKCPGGNLGDFGGILQRSHGIYPEYLNYSVSAWALIIACTIFIFLPLFYWFFVFAKRTRDKNTFSNLLVNLSHGITCILTWIALSYAYPYAEQYDAHLLVLDSYIHSDCRPPAGATAIRKNDKECYQITWQPDSGLMLTEYPAPKP